MKIANLTGMIGLVVLFGTLNGTQARESSKPAHYKAPKTSSQCMFVYGAVTIDGQPAAVGDEVAVLNGQGTVCGAGTVVAGGRLPSVAVYQDDPVTPKVEGAKKGETLFFALWDRSAKAQIAPKSVVANTVGDAKGAPTYVGGFEVVEITINASR